MLPVETIFPAGKQNSEIPHSSLKSRPKGGSVVEVFCEVFLSKKQQGRTGDSNQITAQSAGTELLLYPATHHQGPLSCSAVKYCNTKLSCSVTHLLLELSLHSENFIPENHHLVLLDGADCPLHRHVQRDCGIILGKIKMQRGLQEMGLMRATRKPGRHFPILCSKMVSYYLISLETLLLCEWFDPTARRNCFCSCRENLRVSRTVRSQAGRRDM